MTSLEMYELYEDVRQSGVTNMWDFRIVSELTGLDKEQILFVMHNYSDLKKRYEESKGE